MHDSIVLCRMMKAVLASCLSVRSRESTYWSRKNTAVSCTIFQANMNHYFLVRLFWARASSWTIGLILLAPPRAKRKERKLTPIDYTNSEEIVSFVAKPKTSCRTRDLNQPIDKTEIETFRERCIISELALASQEFDM